MRDQERGFEVAILIVVYFREKENQDLDLSRVEELSSIVTSKLIDHFT
jgi:hypothetical protein